MHTCVRTHTYTHTCTHRGNIVRAEVQTFLKNTRLPLSVLSHNQVIRDCGRMLTLCVD